MIKLCFFVRAEVESSPVHNQMCLFINIHVKNIIYLTEKCLGVFCPMKRFFVFVFSLHAHFSSDFYFEVHLSRYPGSLRSSVAWWQKLLALIQHYCCFQVLSEILQVLSWRQVNWRSDVIRWLRHRTVCWTEETETQYLISVIMQTTPGFIQRNHRLSAQKQTQNAAGVSDHKPGQTDLWQPITWSIINGKEDLHILISYKTVMRTFFSSEQFY